MYVVLVPRQTVRAGIYARQSMGNTKSIDEQDTECAAACETHGWTVTGRYRDGVSASRYTRKTRPDWTRLLSDLQAHLLDVLVLWETSRGDRKLTGWSAMLDLCREVGVLIHVVTHSRTYDPANARDWRSLAEDGVDNAYESDKISLRVNRDMAAAAAKGMPHGKLLFGYKRLYDHRGRFLEQVPHDDQADIVREAARRVAAGEACHSVARDFNARSIPAPRGGRWNLTQIRRVVTNPAYNGLRVHRGQITEVSAQWPALIDDATYAACVRRIDDPRRRTVRDMAVKHLLTGAARCGLDDCGIPLRVQKNRGSFAYLCPAGFHVSIKTTWLEDFVTSVVIEWMSQPGVLDKLGASDAEADSEAAAARAESMEKRARLDGFYDKAAAGELSPAGLARIEARLLPEIKAAEERALAAHVSPVLRALAGPNAEAVWQQFTIGQRREAVALLMDVRVLPTVRGTRRFRPERVQITPKL
jgi:site-specific DNA recombinase